MKYISLAGREHNHEKARSICQRMDASEDTQHYSQGPKGMQHSRVAIYVTTSPDGSHLVHRFAVRQHGAVWKERGFQNTLLHRWVTIHDIACCVF